VLDAALEVDDDLLREADGRNEGDRRKQKNRNLREKSGMSGPSLIRPGATACLDSARPPEINAGAPPARVSNHRESSFPNPA
jgi:hypothetical protein